MNCNVGDRAVTASTSAKTVVGRRSRDFDYFERVDFRYFKPIPPRPCPTLQRFVFQVSPQEAYNESTHPPASWSSAPAPSAITVQAASGGNPARIIIAWADNAIEDRWLRVTLKANANTGLFNAETFYVGHLRGETTGPNGSGVYTVSSVDRSAIQSSLGQSATIGNLYDINKDGQITFADISAAQSNIGDQMANITTAANPLADLTRSQSWSLDALGNWNGLSNNGGPSEARGHNLQNQITSIGSTTLTYDSNGNLTTDDQGRLLVWDVWNRLVEVKQGSTTLVAYQYDGLSSRIVEQIGQFTPTIFYYSDGWQVLEERVVGVTKTQYVWSPVYVDAMILRDRDADANTGNGLEERLYVLHDANFNVTALADTDGEIVERYYYEAYGKATILDSDFVPRPDAQSDYAWQYLHQGGRFDTITENYHFRNRDLSPELGRWLNRDPIGFEGGDWNLYRLVGSHPTYATDPFGLAETSSPHSGPTSGNGSVQNEGRQMHNDFGKGTRLPNGKITDLLEETSDTTTVNELKPENRLKNPSKTRAAERQLEKQMEGALELTPDKKIEGKLWAWSKDAAGKAKYVVVSRWQYVTDKKGEKWVAKKIPFAGILVGIWGWSEDVKAKGPVCGTVNSVLDSCPLVGIGKGILEVGYGDDLIPNLE